MRFHTLSPAASAVALSLFVMLGQMVAWRRDHAAIAGITALAGSATAMALIMATFDPMPFTIALVLTAAIVEYGAWRGRALASRWIVALAADLCAFLLVYLVTRPQGLPEGYAPIPMPTLAVLLIGLSVIYLSSTAARTAFRGLPILWFELFQVPAIRRARRGRRATDIARRRRRCAGGRNGVPDTFGGVLWSRVPRFREFAVAELPGLRHLRTAARLDRGSFAVPRLPLTALWSTLAVAAVHLGSRQRGNTLVMHGAVYLLAAAADSGLLQYTAQALTGTNRALHLTGGALLCSIAAALCYGLTLRFRKRKAGSWTDRAAPAFLAAVLCWSIAGLSAGALARFSFDAPFASTIHTALISAFAILLAWVGRRWNLGEMVWLLFPWMLFGAVKLVAEDFQQGRPATLFLSLFVYGGTLIALPRLLRRNEDYAARKLQSI